MVCNGLIILDYKVYFCHLMVIDTTQTKIIFMAIVLFETVRTMSSCKKANNQIHIHNFTEIIVVIKSLKSKDHSANNLFDI